MKITIIGTGNIGSAIARGLVKGNVVNASQITCTDLKKENLEKLKSDHTDFITSQNNVEAVQPADIVIIAVKPWMVEKTIGEIKEHLDYGKQIFISIAAGVDFSKLSGYLSKPEHPSSPSLPAMFRVIPNIAIEVQSSLSFVASSNASEKQEKLVLSIFDALGTAMLVGENLMTAGTALASSGIAFALRYIRAATEGGVEMGFYPDQAKEIVIKTVKGAVDLLIANGTNPETEIDRVTTPGGITIKGLNKMEEEGFTSSIIKGLKASK